VLCFDCILRRLEAERLGIKDDLLPIFSRYNMIGFNTYGEQYRFLHLSQTLTGLAIGAGPAGAEGGGTLSGGTMS